MTQEKNDHNSIRSILIVASLVIILYGINQAQSVITIFLFSVFLALIATPILHWMEQKKIPSFVAVFTIMAGMVTLLLLIGGFIGATLGAFSDNVPLYQQRLREEVLALKPFLTSKHILVTDKVLLEFINPGPIMGHVVGLLSEMGNALSNILLILLTVTFILLEAYSFPVKIRSIIGDPKRAFPQFTGFVNEMKRYVLIKTLINLIAGTLIVVWLYILGIDFPLLWGFLTFLLLYIPNVGSVIAALPAVLLALVQFGGGTALLVALGYFAVGTVIGNIIEPKIMGKRLGMSTLVVFISLIFWGSLLGSFGVVLCIPLTLTVKFAFESNDETRWIAVLLGPVISTKEKPTTEKNKK